MQKCNVPKDKCLISKIYNLWKDVKNIYLSSYLEIILMKKLNFIDVSTISFKILFCILSKLNFKIISSNNVLRIQSIHEWWNHLDRKYKYLLNRNYQVTEIACYKFLINCIEFLNSNQDILNEFKVDTDVIFLNDKIIKLLTHLWSQDHLTRKASDILSNVIEQGERINLQDLKFILNEVKEIKAKYTILPTISSSTSLHSSLDFLIEDISHLID